MRFSADEDLNLSLPADQDWELVEKVELKEDANHVGVADDLGDDFSDLYDSDDSEEMDYPVSTSTAVWAGYERTTDMAVADALEFKADQVARLDSLITSWTESRRQEVKAVNDHEAEDVRKLLLALRSAQEKEDEERRTAFQKQTDALTQSVEQTIAQERQRLEEERKRAAAIERERLARIAREEEAARKAAQEEKARKEKLAQEARQKEAEAQAAREQETAAKEEAQRRAAAEKAEEEQRRNVLGISPENDANIWRRRLETFKSDVLKPVSESKDLKNFCSRARLRINPRVGQVTNSIEQIGQVCSSLAALFNEAATKDQSGLALRWCLNFLAKAIVKQAEGEVMVKPTACYPLAFLAVSIMKQYPDFLDLFLIRLAKKCPWTVPFVGYDKSTESGRKNLGWKRSAATGKYEEATTYLERQEGIFRLWAASTSLNLTDSPLPISLCMTWLTRLLEDATPLADNELRDVAFALAASFLDIAGRPFMQAFGGQGQEMAKRMATWVGPDVRGAAATRLRIQLEEYLLHGKLGLDFNFEK